MSPGFYPQAFGKMQAQLERLIKDSEEAKRERRETSQKLERQISAQAGQG